ncbi:MAG: alpha-ribazole phosphatase family protein [Chromatiaceae bacterium]|nr:alpha-ribazole phosphatase family protein [Gammaproteobacteria bacterium]MCP5427870.1 alpha-ribazole phosphatase family protein [Chromatiaceae bacterium]MCP5445859.1 alpha-ribazole phosphatase family protein [Chromatiaceae bacterium]
MQSKATIIDLIRHGEPVGGVLIRGQRDDPLSETGWKQMWAAVDGKRSWQRIITSPLLRCANFAHELGRELNVPVTLESRLGEIGFGEWEGMDPAILYRDCPEAIDNFWVDPGAYPPPGGESFIRFQQRVGAALDSILQNYPSEHLLVVAHGGVIRMIIARVLGMPAGNIFRMDVPYAAVSRIAVEQGIPRLRFHCSRL